ncbi:hypothetical protein RHSIM_Rhsim12G0092700 [Rhododendron simsii]|uniref:Uncharacterized protein n=1 Tax=Rhododendron simsii TaxID=118357 RepID=A0A834G5K2_RHOSS|nr:hypothetical protein RHSIM_Rhsim12G0092700 [Rhododendron simsii]
MYCWPQALIRGMDLLVYIYCSHEYHKLGAMRGDDSKELPSHAVIKARNVTADELKEILRELKNVERQNFISHCLLSALIGSAGNEQSGEEESSAGSMLTGILKGSTGNDQSGEKDSYADTVLTRILKGFKGNDQNRKRETSGKGKQIEE